MTVGPEVLRKAMRRWATGVTIVTSKHENVRHGMTVSSFTSVSLAPPLVLVSLEKKTRTLELVALSGAFGVTILAAHQREISSRFSTHQMDPGQRFEGVATHTLVTGTPLISDGLVCFDCRVVNSLLAGNHTVFVGEVMAVVYGRDEQPLLYFDRAYRWLQD